MKRKKIKPWFTKQELNAIKRKARKSIILNMVSGRAFMYDVKDVPGIVDYLNSFEYGGVDIL